MKLSIFTTTTRPSKRGDAIREAMACYNDLADEVVNVSGDWGAFGSPKGEKQVVIRHLWPQEFSWELIGRQFQHGYEACTGDWVIHADLDFIFHQKDFGRIRQALKDYPDAPAVSFYKWQFILPDRYNLKSRLPLAVNKAKFGDRIKFNGGGDLCQPTVDGKELNLNEIPQAGVPFYNYEKLIKTEAQINDDVQRMARAWHRHFGDHHLGTDETAYPEWLHMMQGRFSKPQQRIKLDDHPKYIQETIRNLTPEKWGYNGFATLGVTKCYE